MKVDWDSLDTLVLLNPRISQQHREEYSRRLLDKQLKAHIWVTTSGTTGRFKFVALSKEGILCSAHAVNDHLQSTSSDVWLHSLPDFHVGGLGIWARAYLSGAKVVKFTAKWEPNEFYRLATEERASLTALVPTQVFDLVRGGFKAPSSLRATVVGGGALASTVYQQAQTLGWKVLPSYGLTECASQVATATHGQYDETRVLPHVQIKITDEGFIAVKSSALLTFYGEDSQFYDPKVDGWFTTDDRGELHGNCLKVFGRGSDFIKIGGESVNLQYLQRTLEEVRISLSISQDVVLQCVPNSRLGNAVHLLVEGEENSQIEQLIARYHNRVMPYERIRQVRYLDESSRNFMGKI